MIMGIMFWFACKTETDENTVACKKESLFFYAISIIIARTFQSTIPHGGIDENSLMPSSEFSRIFLFGR